jgi:hypothetical protein
MSNFLLFKDRTQFKDWLLSQKVQRNIITVDNHHTAIPSYKDFNGSNHQKLQQGMRNYHVETNGWKDIAQHFTTFPDGSIMTGRSLESKSAGIYNRGSNSICIENLGNFDKGYDTMTEAQKETIVFLNAILALKFNLVPSKDTIIYHRWFRQSDGVYDPNSTGKEYKSCPGTNFFGGNSVESAKKNFIPLVKAKLEVLKMGKFKDLEVNGVRHWAADLIEEAADMGLVFGSPSGDGSFVFNPDTPITRAENVAILMRYIKSQKK